MMRWLLRGVGRALDAEIAGDIFGSHILSV